MISQSNDTPPFSFLILIAIITADVVFTSVVPIYYYYYYFFDGLSLFSRRIPFFLLSSCSSCRGSSSHDDYFFFSASFLVFSPSVYTSVVSYQQIHCSTDWLFQRWTNISRHCTERKNAREREREKRKLPRRSPSSSDTKARSSWCSLSSWLFYYRHRAYFPFLILSSSSSSTSSSSSSLFFEPDINRHVDSLINKSNKYFRERFQTRNDGEKDGEKKQQRERDINAMRSLDIL